MKILERELGTLVFAAGQSRTVQLPRNYAYRKLYFKLVLSGVFRTGASGTGGPRDSSPAHLIQNITVRANGRDVIKSLPFAFIHRATQNRYGCRPYIAILDASGDPSATWEGNTAITTGANDLDMTIHGVIDFEMWRAIRPADTFFNSAGLATLELIITWGQLNDLMDDAYADEVELTEDATLYISTLEAVGVPAGSAFMLNKENQIQKQVTAATTNLQVDIPVGNIYRSFILETKSDNCNVNSILNNIKLKSGTEVFKNRIAGSLQCDNRVEYQMEGPIANDTIDRYWNNSLCPGYYIIEFVKDGRLTECLDTSRLSSLEFILDVNHPGTDDFVNIYPVELLLPAKPAKAS